MSKKLIRIFLLLLLLVGGLSLSSCIHLGNSGPSTSVNSYDEVKRELADLPGAIFFDISAYDENAFYFWVSHPPPNGEPKTGYLLYADTNSVAHLEKTDTGSTLSYLALGCGNLELLYQEENFTPAIAANTVHRGVPMEVHFTDESDWYEREYDTPNSSHLFPRGTQLLRFTYKFSFNECLYTMEIMLRIPPEQVEMVDIEEEKAAADAEAWGLIDNILDQGGVSK
jgi:hypothetical protein